MGLLDEAEALRQRDVVTGSQADFKSARLFSSHLESPGIESVRPSAFSEVVENHL